MKNKTITKVIRVDNETKKLMADFYKDMKRDKTPPYAIFQADTGDTIVTLYESGKAMFQGVSADIEAGMWESIGKDKENIDYFIDREEVKEKKEETTIPIDISSVGSDEVGTGDYYGPIVVTASYVNKDDIPFLTELGVKDSKKLSDEQILKIVPKIIKKIKYKTIMLSNKEYNKNYGKDMNMNKIKAVLHNKVLTEMVKDNEYDYIVVPNKSDGSTDKEKIEKIIRNHAMQGWRLITMYSNEIGKNAIAGVNATMCEDIMVFERCIKGENV